MNSKLLKHTFPVSTVSLLRSHRKHMAELVASTDFLNPSHGYQRLAHFAAIDDLLVHLFVQEHSRAPGTDEKDRISERPEELGPIKPPAL